MKRYPGIAGFIFITLCVYSCPANEPEPSGRILSPRDANIADRWVSSENLQISVNRKNDHSVPVTSGHRDYKPSWSKNGDRITFFRLVSKGRGFHTWRTRICVVNIDGAGFSELTTGDYPDFNPTWTRDGSEWIIFNRYARKRGWKNRIYMMPPDGSPGDEQLVSHPSNAYYEWAMSALQDGRIFIDRKGDDFARSFLLTPNPGKAGRYEEIQRPTAKFWHKLSVSPSETKVAYMLDNDRKLHTYKDVVIAIADFDRVHLKIENQRIITEMDRRHICEYPRWSRDEQYVIYDSNRSGKFQIYAFHLETETTARISPNVNNDYRFASFEYLPK